MNLIKTQDFFTFVGDVSLVAKYMNISPEKYNIRLANIGYMVWEVEIDAIDEEEKFLLEFDKMLYTDVDISVMLSNFAWQLLSIRHIPHLSPYILPPDLVVLDEASKHKDFQCLYDVLSQERNNLLADPSESLCSCDEE